jgi:hypothetical protein
MLAARKWIELPGCELWVLVAYDWCGNRELHPDDLFGRQTCWLLNITAAKMESGQGNAPCACGLQPQPFACSVAGQKFVRVCGRVVAHPSAVGFGLFAEKSNFEETRRIGQSGGNSS